MGVFEFVIAIIFMSFVFKVIKLRYESQENNQTNGAAKGAAHALGVNSAMDRQGRASKRASQKSAGASSLWRFLFFAACCLIPMAFFFFAAFEDRPVGFQSVPAMPEMPAMAEMPEFSSSPVGSTPEAVHVPPNANSATKLKQPNEAPDEFLADYYPSIVDCAAPMAIKIYNEISDELPTESSPEVDDTITEEDKEKPNEVADNATTEPTEFYITNDGLSDQDYIPFVVAFRKKIKAKVKNSSVIDRTGLGDYLPPPKSLYRIVVSSLGRRKNGGTDYSAGRVICKVKGKNTSTEVITNYVRKLWLTDFQAFAAKNPNKQYVVGRCDKFFPEQSEARERALENAVDTTVETDTGIKYIKDGREYRETDSLSQKYERPYGDVFRCAVLLELDLDRPVRYSRAVNRNPTTLNPATQSSFLASVFDCGWRPSFEWSVALLIGLTVVIGTISNVLTQGYYRTEISSSMMVAVLVGFCLLIAVIVSTIG